MLHCRDIKNRQPTDTASPFLFYNTQVHTNIKNICGLQASSSESLTILKGNEITRGPSKTTELLILLLQARHATGKIAFPKYMWYFNNSERLGKIWMQGVSIHVNDQEKERLP